MATITQFMREAVIKHMADNCEWAEKDEETGQLYIRFNEIRITDTSAEFIFNGSVIYTIDPILDHDVKLVPISLTGFEGRMKMEIET